MKYVIGFIVCILVLITALYVILGFWGIEMFDSEHLVNTYKTIGIVIVVALFLIMTVSFFFKRDHKGYDTTKGNIAHPKK
ncbi:hypothetical protein [Myroides odoratimimus]|uniref:hypothetical protein n=1 Tax=Myroides odoratimimus TaxID=76832 RepID=UPI0025753540|nr:hypothetical protein [Myroides odoratimimus]MDM1529394.1 hypothetical protein [Myroides odoratimimus]